MMTDADIQRACDHASAALEDAYGGGIEPEQGSDWHPEHIAFMLGRIPELVAAGRREKAMRWLGFVQGYLWAKGIASIDALKAANRPEVANG